MLLSRRRRTDIIGSCKLIATIRHVIIFMISWCVGFVEIALFIILSKRRRWWTIPLTLTKLQIIFIECTANVWSLFSWTTTTTVNTANTLLFWRTIDLNLAPYFFLALFTNICKPKYISIGVKKSKRRILFVVEKLYLKDFPI